MVHKITALLPPGHPWGQRIIHFDTVDSTNTYAKKIAADGAPNGTVIIADAQTGGRGRLGRSFSSPAGLGLYLSVILRPQCPPDALMHLTCAAGVAASDAVQTSAGITPGIKWTNDLVIGRRKLGGILTELSIDPATKLVDYAVIGIGINCKQQENDFPPEIRDIATSLFLSGGEPDRVALAAALIHELYQMNEMLLTQKAQVMAVFTQRCVTLGKEISIVRGEQVLHAKALAVDEDGGLVVAFPDGSHTTVSSGEVSIRGMYGYL